MSANYQSGFGFVVCAFDPTPEVMHAHPIAYFSDMMSHSRVFIPTRHEHGDAHAGATHKMAKFDHTIYVGDYAGTSQLLGGELSTSKCIKWHALPKLADWSIIYRYTVNGFSTNDDQTVSVEFHEDGSDAVARQEASAEAFRNAASRRTEFVPTGGGENNFGPFGSPVSAPFGLPKAHVGYHCDVCGATSIRGARYRCTICTDFDLCELCESHNYHNVEHPLIKYKVPK